MDWMKRTLDQLKAINEAIDAEHTANDSRIAALNTTNSSLETLKADNAKVIANFENLLS